MSSIPTLETLFHQLAEAIKQTSSDINQETLTEWVERCQTLANSFSQGEEDAYQLGQEVACQLISYWPQLSPLIPRDLLWLLGGDCLHFMPDEEIAVYQQLEEEQAQADAAGQPFDWPSTKQILTEQPIVSKKLH